MQTILIKQFLGTWILQYLVSHVLLEYLTVVYFFFDRVIQKESVYDHITLLANSECSIGGLDVDHWVPVWIKDYNFISTFQINTKPTNLSSQKEDKNILSLVIPINDFLSLPDGYGAVHADVFVVVVGG